MFLLCYRISHQSFCLCLLPEAFGALIFSLQLGNRKQRFPSREGTLGLSPLSLVIIVQLQNKSCNTPSHQTYHTIKGCLMFSDEAGKKKKEYLAEVAPMHHLSGGQAAPAQEREPREGSLRSPVLNGTSYYSGPGRFLWHSVEMHFNGMMFWRKIQLYQECHLCLRNYAFLDFIYLLVYYLSNHYTQHVA